MNTPSQPGYYWFKRHSWNLVPFQWEIVQLCFEDREWVVFAFGNDNLDIGDLAQAATQLAALGEWGPAIPPYTGN